MFPKMKWRLPIISIYVALLSMMGVGLLDNFTSSVQPSSVTHFEGDHKHGSRIRLGENFYSDNTEDEDHDSFVGFLSPLTFVNNLVPCFSAEPFKLTLNKGIAETNLFLLFRSILI
jgi:hypothetical protein